MSSAQPRTFSSSRATLLAFIVGLMVLIGLSSKGQAQTSNTCYVSYSFSSMSMDVYTVDLMERGRTEPSRRNLHAAFGGSATWDYISTGRWYQLRVTNSRGQRTFGAWVYIFPGTTRVTLPRLYF